MQERQIGAIYALSAFLVWGFLPIYWKLIQHVPPIQILAHRIIWSFVFLIVFVYYRKRMSEFLAIFRQPKALFICFVCAVLVSSNWGLYVWAVNSNHLLEASLGYFMNPLLNISLGVLLLREKMRPLQWTAVGVAAFSVILASTHFDHFPWISLNLATSFALYAYIRKTAKLDSLMGATVEVTMMLPIAFALFLWGQSHPDKWNFVMVFKDIPLLIGAGVLTSIPLLWFNYGTKILKLSTIGLLQYLSPSIQFLLAVFLYQEQFTVSHKVSFGLIWVALFLSTVDAIQYERKRVTQSIAH